MFRRYQHNKLTFSLVYAFSENYVLPISHDEVVHGKHSLLDKMPGTYDEKFANLRAFLGYMMTHPGKKLSFMGYEFGQFTEWNYSKELDWLLLGYDKHQKLFQYVKDLNRFYLNHSCLWEIDCSWEGFKWINSDDADYNCLSFRRINAHKRELIIAINFSGINLMDYRLGLRSGSYQEVMNSDALIYGGNGLQNSNLRTSLVPCHGSDSSLTLNIPAFSIVILKRIGKE
jgi:1,4-alpha-glucan branching enzyme